MSLPSIDFHPRSDKKLRSRVKLLGKLIGNVLLKHETPEVFHAVEALRTGFIQLRKRDSEPKRRELMRLIEGLSAPVMTQVIRAFATYFSLVNIAEEDFLHRLRRDSVKEQGHAAWVGSFFHTLEQFRAQGVDADELRELFAGLCYWPVFTAHPTESRRRTVMHHQREIFKLIDALTDPRLSPFEREDLVEALQLQIETLWLTNEVRASKPTVEDEIKMGLHYFQRSLFEAVRIDYRHLERAVVNIYGEDEYGNPVVEVPSMIRFGSWIGGDRDGNPFVTPATTRKAVLMQAEEILAEHIRLVYRLTYVLTMSTRWFTPSAEFDASLERDQAMGVAAFDRRRDQFEDEVYRRKLYHIHYRLRQNLARVRERLNGDEPAAGEHAYDGAEAYLEDLYTIRDSLTSHGEFAAASGDLKDTIRIAETFGFHLVNLDLRQESTRHTAAVAALLAANRGIDYAGLGEAARVELLAAQIDAGDTAASETDALDASSRETLDVFRLIGELRAEIGHACIGSYVISMTHQASHVLEVMYLASVAGLCGRRGDEYFNTVEVAPLFETIEDLGHIDTVLDELLANPVYRGLLAAGGGTQEIMLGYSDSCKDGGILSAAWGLYQAQLKVVEIGDRHDVDVRIFHGRGGTITRGGGPTHEAIIAQPPGTVRGKIKFTEQGEVLSHKYGNAETANYELAMGITGLMKASLGPRRVDAARDESYHARMQTLADASEAFYRDLTDQTDGFFEFFYQATPVSEIGLMNIGSRPSHRRQGDLSKASVRAIPWVFGWSLSRTMMPAWYGVGHAIGEWLAADDDARARLAEMNRDWPFFAALISNLQMSLFKADMRIAREYGKLCDDAELAQRIFARIENEYRRSVDAVLATAGVDSLLADDPVLKLSLSRRDPYLDPLAHLQIALLRNYRDPTRPDDEREQWQIALTSSINAIAAGLRNTG